MFGYLRPYKEELRVKDIKKYSSYYCALCNEIKKDYGRFWTFFLNYESVYILLFLESYMTNEKEEQNITCHMNPFMKKKAQINHKNLEYAAFVNMFLLEMKFEDDESDEGKLLYRFLRKRLNKKNLFQEMSQKHNRLIEVLREQSTKLHELEMEKGTIDSCAGTTGVMLSAIINYWVCSNQEDFEEEENLKKLHYHIGKLIYILDAFQDFERDVKKSQFNPMIYMQGTEEELKNKVEQIIILFKFSIKREIERVPLITNVDIVTNILTFGIEHTIERIKREKKKKCIRSAH